MKKAFAMVLALILFLTGCAAPKNERETLIVESSSTSTTNTTDDKANDNTITAPQYDEKVPLFICQDRADIEGDRDSLYYYNYKGELLENAVMPNVGFFGNNGLAPAFDPATEKIGYVDKSGVFAIDPQWDDAAAFSDDGIALVITEIEDEEGWTEEKYGFINEKGEQIAPCIYDDATSFYPCGLAIIGIDAKEEYTYTDDEGNIQKDVLTVIRWGVINKDGKVIIEPQFKHIEHITADYIICFEDDGCKIYDLSGNVLDECESYIDEATSYYYEINNGKLYRYVRTLKDPGKEISEITFEDYTFSQQRVFNGKEFDYDSLDYDGAYIRCERVATTSSGMGYGVWQAGEKRGEGEVVIPYEYDQILRYGSYYVGIKYQNGDETDQLLDIYNSKFEKTVEKLDYNFERYRTEAFGDRIMLPDGYFEVSYYDTELRETISGIIDYTGEFVVPPLFYRAIKLFTYEGVGGKFVH